MHIFKDTYVQLWFSFLFQQNGWELYHPCWVCTIIKVSAEPRVRSLDSSFNTQQECKSLKAKWQDSFVLFTALVNSWDEIPLSPTGEWITIHGKGFEGFQHGRHHPAESTACVQPPSFAATTLGMRYIYSFPLSQPYEHSNIFCPTENNYSMPVCSPKGLSHDCYLHSLFLYFERNTNLLVNQQRSSLGPLLPVGDPGWQMSDFKQNWCLVCRTAVSLCPVLPFSCRKNLWQAQEGLMCCQESALRPAAIMKQQIFVSCSLCNNIIVKDFLLPFSIAQYKMKRERRVGDK